MLVHGLVAAQHRTGWEGHCVMSTPMWLAADSKWLYTVALPRQVVTVFEHILAPEYPEGEVVMYRGSDSTSTPATVVSTDASHWYTSQLSYLIRLPAAAACI